MILIGSKLLLVITSHIPYMNSIICRRICIPEIILNSLQNIEQEVRILVSNCLLLLSNVFNCYALFSY